MASAPVADRRPGIFQVGQVEVGDGQVKVTGWGLKRCFSECNCHKHPVNGQLYVSEDDERGLLGLKSFATGGCNCCSPWTTEELVSVLQTFDMLAKA